MPTLTAALSLDYAFVSTPNPILASVAGSNPSTIALQVIVSNPSEGNITLERITIEIPTGQNTSNAISTATRLPAPTYDTDGAWRITSSGETITIAPVSGRTGTVTSPVILTLPGIQVNETPGTVPITVTEFLPPPAPKIVDGSTYKLLKLPADFPVTSFYADPPVLTDLGQGVTLYWTCSAQGQGDVYGLQAIVGGTVAARPEASPSGRPAPLPEMVTTTFKDCIGDGNCYTCVDGTNGVSYAPVNRTTTFQLDIVQTTGGGDRVIVGTLQTTVQVLIPSFATASRLRPSVSGRLVWLYWLAFNAGHCSVQLDDEVIDSRAPTDTYENGYLVVLPESVRPGTHQLSVIAHAVTGPAQSSTTFPPFAVVPPVTVWTGTAFQRAAATPDGSLALVTSWNGNFVQVIDITTHSPEPAMLPVTRPFDIGISPNGALALVTQPWFNRVSVIDIATRSVEAEGIAVPEPTVLAFTPSATLALVGCGTAAAVAVIDVATRRAETTRLSVGGSPRHIVVTPDGSLALVSTYGGTDVWVIDIAARRVEEKRLPIGGRLLSIGITADGASAFALREDNAVTVIDIASRTVEPHTIPVNAVGGKGSGAGALAISQNDQWAFVVQDLARTASAINLSARTSQPFAPETDADGLVMSPTGTALLVSKQRAGAIVLY